MKLVTLFIISLFLILAGTGGIEHAKNAFQFAVALAVVILGLSSLWAAVSMIKEKGGL